MTCTYSLIYTNNVYDYVTPKFLPTNRFKQIDPKVLDLNKYTRNSSTGCVAEVELEHPKYLQGLHNNYPLTPVKIGSKEEMLSDYQSKTSDIYNISIGNIKNVTLNLLDKETYMIRYENLQLYLRVGLKLKKYIVYQDSINCSG